MKLERKKKTQSNERHHVGCDYTLTHPSPCESQAKKNQPQDTYTETETSVHLKKKNLCNDHIQTSAPAPYVLC